LNGVDVLLRAFARHVARKVISMLIMVGISSALLLVAAGLTALVSPGDPAARQALRDIAMGILLVGVALGGWVSWHWEKRRDGGPGRKGP